MAISRQLTWQNWSGLQRCEPEEIRSPKTEQELAEAIAHARTIVRPVGSGHSFSSLIPTNQTLISLQALELDPVFDMERSQVTCGAGVTIHQLGPQLHSHGLALTNQGDVDAQTLAGACNTGTHGTGPTFGCLASEVVGFRLVTADGDVLAIDKHSDPELFFAGRVSLGVLGVLSYLTIRCVPAFSLSEKIAAMPIDECLERTADLASSNRHFEFFHFPYSDRVLVKTMNLTSNLEERISNDEDEDRVFGWACRLARTIPALNPALQRLGMKWYPGRERCGPSHRIFPSARTVRFNEMEYEIEVDRAVECYREIVDAIRSHRPMVCFPIEFRRVKADSMWLSPFFERDSVAISVHQHWQEPFEPLFRLLEPIFWKYGGRPHWGKLHTLSGSQLRHLYPRWDDFAQFRARLDPRGKFLNDSLRRYWEP